MISVITLFSEITPKEECELFFSKNIESQFLGISDFNIIPPIRSKKELINYGKEALLNSFGVILVVGTGGVESIASEIFRYLATPILIYVHPDKNSLAAGLEIYSHFKKDHIIEMFYSPIDKDQIKKRFLTFQKVTTAVEKIDTSIVGVIGAPSPWILSSKNLTKFPGFRTKIKTLKIDELTQLVFNDITQDQIEPILNRWEKYGNFNNFVEKSVEDSAKVIPAIEKIIKKYDLDSLTIKCFDLLNFKLTSCMAVNEFNNRGIVTSCEGDLETLFSMMVGYFLTSQPMWMANPSSLHFETNSITFAHCTAPTKLLKDGSIELKTHMESNSSIAIEGSFEKKEVTIFRFGEHLKSVLISKGEIIETNMKNSKLCRTQIVVKLDGDVKSWLENGVGNHQVIGYGDFTNLIEQFAHFKGVKILKI